MKYEGRSGDLVPVTASFDASGRYGLQTPFSEGVSRLWKGSMWHVDGRPNSLITTGNGGSEPTRAAMTLFYNDGKSSYTIEKLLEPGEQIWADVGEIIRAQIPDKEGKTIPPDVMMGSYELRDLDHRGIGYLYEGKLIIDKTWGHGYYGCAGCCGFYASRMDPNPMGGAMTTGAYNEADAEENCGDGWQDVTDQATGWASGNSAVVTLAKAYTKFVGVGSTGGSAELTLEGNIERNGVCLTKYFEPQNTQNTTPSISWNGTVISNTTTQNAVIGQQIVLTGSPGGGTWSVPNGTAAAGWAYGAGNPPQTGGPSAFATSGTTNTFYWVMGGRYAIKYTASGSSTSATFMVAAPTVTVTATIPGNDMTSSSSGSTVTAFCGNGSAPTYCINLHAAITPPTGYSGNYQWTQVVDAAGWTYTATDGSQHACSLTQQVPALDNHLVLVTNADLPDSPNQPAGTSGRTSIAPSQTLSAVLEWQPSLGNNVTTIPVPISSTNWTWGATETLQNGVWGMTSATYPSNPPQIQYGAYWPVWYSVVSNTGQDYTCK